ncbi:MAG: tripartite tricarboxylate transporter substrate binding protein [Burkholderiaceae bacterium]|nr:tripartite tricarboxylate transporter substrate binding protein [Burkholderiaceae bacterium]
MTQRRRQVIRVAGAAAVLGAAGPLRALGTAVRIVVAYPPGGVSDAAARLLATLLEPALQAPVIVENRGGAGGSVALAGVARAAPDGRTLGFSAISPLTLSPHFGVAAPPVVPVIGVMRTPQLLVATPAMAATGFADMLRLARARAASAAGGLRWATSGVGTLGHLILEEVRRATQLDVVHIPYAGGAPQLQDALAGRFELLSTNLAPLQLDYVASGRLVPLALGARQRTALLPQVPTFAEVDCPGANRSSLFGLFAPQGTPAVQVARLHAACSTALRQPAFVQMLGGSGNESGADTAEAFAREIAHEFAANRGLFTRR